MYWNSSCPAGGMLPSGMAAFLPSYSKTKFPSNLLRIYSLFRASARRPFSRRGLAGAVLKAGRPPLMPWPRGTCRGQGDSILPVSETIMCLMLAALWQGELMAALGAVGEEDFRWHIPETKRRRYYRSGCGMVIRIYGIFRRISLNSLPTERDLLQTRPSIPSYKYY